MGLQESAPQDPLGPKSPTWVMDNVVLELKTVAALLRAARDVHLQSHWWSHGPTQYSDHVLFENAYEGLDEPLDTLMEKMVSSFGPESASMEDVSRGSSHIVGEIFPSGSSPDADSLVGSSLAAEEMLRSALLLALEALDGGGHIGITVFLEDVVSQRERPLYLLRSRARV